MRNKVNKTNLGVGVGLAVLLLMGGSARSQGPQELPTNSIKYNSGQSIQPAFEGWTRNPDGTFSMWFGYMNRNYKETPDIPPGPNNGFGAAGEDMGQPTHFQTRRADTVFKVVVPADWPKDRDLIWTVNYGGQALKAFGSLWPVWEIENIDAGVRQGRTFGDPDNAPPRFTAPLPDQTAMVGQPLTLAVSVTDDGQPAPARRGGGAAAAAGRAGGAPAGGAAAAPDAAPLPDAPVLNPQGLRVRWVQWRGAGTLKFEPVTGQALGTDKRPSDTAGTATTKVTFDKPGSYTVRAFAQDRSPNTAMLDIKVTVK